MKLALNYLKGAVLRKNIIYWRKIMIEFKELFASQERAMEWYSEADAEVRASYPFGKFLDSMIAHDYKEVHALEPSQFLAYIINYSQYHIDGTSNVFVHKLAAGKRSGEIVTLYKPIDGTPGDCSIIRPIDKEIDASENCITISLEDIFKLIGHDHIDYMKIDIEGSEYDFLLEKDLSNIALIAMEFHGSDQQIKDRLFAHLGKYMHVWKYLDQQLLCLNRKYSYKIEPRGYYEEEEEERPLEKLY
jgi:FkbM family methyltransferase